MFLREDERAEKQIGSSLTGVSETEMEAI